MSYKAPIYSCLQSAKGCANAIEVCLQERSQARDTAALLAAEERAAAQTRIEEFVDRHSGWQNQSAVLLVRDVFVEIANENQREALAEHPIMCSGASLILRRCTAQVQVA